MNRDAIERTILQVGAAVVGVLIVGIAAALVLGPLEGNWTPDVALGIFVGCYALCYGLYRWNAR